jgi:hypothetical protein
VAAQLVASQEGLNSMELVSYVWYERFSLSRYLCKMRFPTEVCSAFTSEVKRLGPQDLLIHAISYVNKTNTRLHFPSSKS